MTTSLRLLVTLGLLTAGLVGVALQRPATLQTLQLSPSGSKSVEVLKAPREALAALERMKAKTKVIDRLLRGELSLFEAAGQFRHLNNEPSDCPSYSWEWLSGANNNEKVCRQVLYWVEGQLLGDRAPEEDVRALMDRLEWELRQHLEAYGSVVLPGWEPGD